MRVWIATNAFNESFYWLTLFQKFLTSRKHVVAIFGSKFCLFCRFVRKYGTQKWDTLNMRHLIKKIIVKFDIDLSKISHPSQNIMWYFPANLTTNLSVWSYMQHILPAHNATFRQNNKFQFWASFFCNHQSKHFSMLQQRQQTIWIKVLIFICSEKLSQ